MLILYAKIEETKHQALLSNNLSFFSKDYQEQLYKYRRWEDAQLSLLGRMLMRKGMHFYGKDINLKDLKFTKYNKPFLKNSDVLFNISHSAEIVAVCLTCEDYGTIGIDIEKNHNVQVENFRNQMTKKEQQRIFRADIPLDAFFIYWTQKESVLKAHGNGLSIPLKSFEIENNKTVIGNDEFHILPVEFEKGYTCHLASKQKMKSQHIEIKKIDINKFI